MNRLKSIFSQRRPLDLAKAVHQRQGAAAALIGQTGTLTLMLAHVQLELSCCLRGGGEKCCALPPLRPPASLSTSDECVGGRDGLMKGTVLSRTILRTVLTAGPFSELSAAGPSSQQNRPHSRTVPRTPEKPVLMVQLHPGAAGEDGEDRRWTTSPASTTVEGTGLVVLKVWVGLRVEPLVGLWVEPWVSG